MSNASRSRWAAGYGFPYPYFPVPRDARVD
jgi:hypothetical protein